MILFYCIITISIPKQIDPYANPPKRQFNIPTNESSFHQRISYHNESGPFSSYLQGIRATRVESMPDICRQNGLYSISVDHLTYDSFWTLSRNTGNEDQSFLQSSTPGSKLFCEFYGCKVALYAFRNSNYGGIKIYIDNVLVETVSTSSGSGLAKVWEKLDLKYGSHKFEAECETTNPIRIYGVLVQAGQDNDNHYINVCSQTITNGGNNCNSANEPIKKHWWSNVVGTLTYTFVGTRFWLTGTTGNHNSGHLTIDGGPQIPVNGAGGRYMTTLLYQSEPLELKTHTVVVTTGTKFELSDFIYIQKPHNAVYVDLQEIRAENWVTHEETAISTSSQDARINFQFYGTKFWIIGDKGMFKVGPESNEKEIDQSTLTTTYNVLYESNSLPLDYYTSFYIKNAAASQLIIRNIFTINEAIMIPCKQNTLGVANLTGSFTRELIPGTEFEYAKITAANAQIRFSGSQFWL